MRKLQLILILAIYQVVLSTSKTKNSRYPDDVPSAEELDARLEKIQKTIAAALENKAILRQGENANAQENSHKIVLTEEERKHVKNIMSGIEEDHSTSEDIDKLNVIFSAINDNFDHHEKAQKRGYHYPESMQSQQNTHLQDHSEQLQDDNVDTQAVTDDSEDDSEDIEIEEEE